jgi:hypothetical protein
MDAARSSETSLSIYQTVRYNIPEAVIFILQYFSKRASSGHFMYSCSVEVFLGIVPFHSVHSSPIGLILNFITWDYDLTVCSLDTGDVFK